MIAYEFNPLAEIELLEATDYYASLRAALGQSFLLEISAALQQIRSVPRSGPVVRGKYRKKLVRKFPYILFYSIEEQGLVIHAVAHQKRRPGYWLDRLPL